MNDYATKFSGIRALNYSEEVDYVNNPYKSASECGPPEGVDLFQWPQAIMCWVQNLSLPRISAGSCGP